MHECVREGVRTPQHENKTFIPAGKPAQTSRDAVKLHCQARNQQKIQNYDFICLFMLPKAASKQANMADICHV